MDMLLNAESEIMKAIADHYGTEFHEKKTPQSLSNMVYDHVIQKLIRGEIAPGDELNRRDVAKECGVSVAPVLEAMIQLENEGFLEVAPRRATRVKVASRQDLRDQLILREALECQAARLYCGDKIRGAEKELIALARIIDETRKTSAESWWVEVHFHGRLVSLSGCQALFRTYNKVMRVGFFYSLNTILPHQTWDSNHSEFVRSLCSTRDAYFAEAIAREHIVRGREELLGEQT